MNARAATSATMATVLLLLGGCARNAGGNASAAESGQAEREAGSGAAQGGNPAAGTSHAIPTPVVDSTRGGTMGGRGMMGGAMMGGGMMSGPADTAAAPPARTATGSAGDCPDISQSLATSGRTVFTGVGNCYACHGSDAHGTAVAPNLTDATWLDIDGSYAAIVNLVRSGVPHPKEFPAPMPAMGGAQLTSDQVCAVAAYVRGLGS